MLLTALGFVKFKQVQSAIAAGSSFQPPPEAVTSIVAKQEQWSGTLNMIGTVEAVHGVTVSADLAGIVGRINFESGQAVSEGAVLVELDTKQEHAQLASLEAQRELAHANFDRMDGLVKAGVISRMEYDQATAQQKATAANVAEIKATIERKTIRAPFSGILGIRKVNLGQYLSAGDPVVPLQALNPIYVNFGVPQQSAGGVQAGRSLRVSTDGLKGQEFSGRVTAVDAVVDATTRNVQVQATLANPGGKLYFRNFAASKIQHGPSSRILKDPRCSPRLST